MLWAEVYSAIQCVWFIMLVYIISKQIKVILVSSYKSKIDQVQIMSCANVCGTEWNRSLFCFWDCEYNNSVCMYNIGKLIL